jgi:LEA14-like dessication related protein
MRAWPIALSVLLGAARLLVGCARPSPPEITPEKVAIGAVTATGVELRATMQAYNPNSFDLTAQEVKAKITLNHTYDVGTVASSKTLVLPSGQRTALDVPLSVTWTDLPEVIALAALAEAVPYAVDGTIAVGGQTLHIDVPFHLEGALTHAQLVEATRRSLPFPVP